MKREYKTYKSYADPKVFERAVEIVGGLTPMAKIVGVQAVTISRWIDEGRPKITGIHAIEIERLTQGVIKKEDLIPLIEW